MKFEQIITDLQNKVYYPLYMLSGQEPFFIDQISDQIEDSVLSESEREFNQTVIYGRDTDIATIVSYAKRFPMMSNYQVVIVKEAQELNNIDELESYAKQPLDSTILVLCYKYKKYDQRKTLAKIFKKKGVFFESKKLYENQIPQWITSKMQSDGYSITPKAAALLTEFLGTDLSKISNELGKIQINVAKETQVTDAIIEEYIGISKDFNVFELQKALGSKDVVKANQIINHFAANQKDNPLVKVVGFLFSYFNKVLIFHQIKDRSRNNIASILAVHPFFVNDYQQAAKSYSFNKLTAIISMLREYDLKAKGVGNISITDGELMKELVFKILH